jgi:hypothetical protein
MVFLLLIGIEIKGSLKLAKYLYISLGGLKPLRVLLGLCPRALSLFK